jgi:hypothetical protein
VVAASAGARAHDGNDNTAHPTNRHETHQPAELAQRARMLSHSQGACHLFAACGAHSDVCRSISRRVERRSNNFVVSDRTKLSLFPLRKNPKQTPLSIRFRRSSKFVDYPRVDGARRARDRRNNAPNIDQFA